MIVHSAGLSSHLPRAQLDGSLRILGGNFEDVESFSRKYPAEFFSSSYPTPSTRLGVIHPTLSTFP